MSETHPLKSFEPICYLVRGPYVIVVNNASPYRTLADLLSAARAKPGNLTMASGGGFARVTSIETRRQCDEPKSVRSAVVVPSHRRAALAVMVVPPQSCKATAPTIHSAASTPGELAMWRGLFDEAMASKLANPKVGLMKLPPANSQR